MNRFPVKQAVLGALLAVALFLGLCVWLFGGLTCGGTGCR